MSTITLIMTFAEITEEDINPAPRLMSVEDFGIQQFCLEMEICAILSDTQTHPPLVDPNWDFSRLIKAADDVRAAIADCYEITEAFFNENGHLQVEYQREV